MTPTQTLDAQTANPRAALPDDTRPELRITALDGLRTFAILIVVLYHLHIPFFTGGFIGVNVFYALSGYLITSILLRERQKTGRIRLGRFWLRRILRLYPGLVALVAVSVCFWYLIGNYKGANVDAGMAALLALTYTANVGRWLWHKSLGVLSQTWSLGMEEQFYLVWPPILALAARLRAHRLVMVWSLVVVFFASSAGGWWLYQPRTGTATPDVYFSPVLNLGPLVAGVILALLLTDVRVSRAFAGRLGLWFTGIGGVGIAALELAIQKGWEGSSLTFGVELPLAGVLSTMLIAGLVSRPSILGSVLSFAPISWFGRNASYSLYLWHILVISIVALVVPGTAGKIIAIVAAILVAIASHFAIERPFARLKKRLEPPRAANEHGVKSREFASVEG